MSILGLLNSAANIDMMAKIWTNGDTINCLSRKQCGGKRRNCSLRAISPFPTMFSKAVCCFVKTSTYGVKGSLNSVHYRLSYSGLAILVQIQSICFTMK